MTTTIALQILVRAAIQVAVGYFIAKGWAKEGSINADEIAGAIVFCGTVAWSLYSKQKLLKQTPTPSQDA